MILLVDNYDSFTYNLFQYLRRLGRETVVARNDALDLRAVVKMRPELIVLSPGPGGPEASGICRTLVESLHGDVPILGVCLGMQTIAVAFGGSIMRAKQPMHGKVRPVQHDGTGLFTGLPNPLQVTRYHSLVVDEARLPECLRVTARSDEGEVMGLSHTVYPVSGVQFHPEALLTEGGLQLLANALPVLA